MKRPSTRTGWPTKEDYLNRLREVVNSASDADEFDIFTRRAVRVALAEIDRLASELDAMTQVAATGYTAVGSVGGLGPNDSLRRRALFLVGLLGRAHPRVVAEVESIAAEVRGVLSASGVPDPSSTLGSSPPLPERPQERT